MTQTSSKGLTTLEAHKRLKLYGPNQVILKKRKSAVIELLKNFTNPLVIILLVIVAISFILGESLNAIIVSAMVVLSVTLNFVQEHKASRAAEKLQEKVALLCTVIRDGKEQDIRASHLTVGDLLVLNAGDLIPADGKIIESKDFFVNEAAITGESFPVEKDLSNNTILSGTSVVTGTAKAIIEKIGAATEFGQIKSNLETTEINSFTVGIGKFSFFILRIVLVFVLFIFAVNALFKHDFLESLTFAIAVAVGLTPEFLPMIMTVTMGKGASLMAKRGVIVKKLTAIPTFGSMNILCTDKTGTITQDLISLVKYVDSFGHESDSVLKFAYLNSSFQTGINNPLDQAVLRYKHLDITPYQKIDEIPFDFIRRRMSVIVKEGSSHLMITKGAPEEMFAVSKYYEKDGKAVKLDENHTKKLHQLYQDLSKDGFRVLGIAKRVVNQEKSYDKEDEKDLTFLGFTAFLDPVKEGAKHAIDEIERIGIEVKVVTGDNEIVSVKACEEAGINVKGIMLGSETLGMSDQELGQKALVHTIFARFSPTQKERLIKALKLTGNVVGYMGDGINDAPSIAAADVGISVSNAVDVAKESADFILTHKSLLELKEGIVEGRKIFGNTMKYILMGLSSNFGNMFSVLGAVLFLPFLPMLPIQILLNNFLYDLSQVTIPTDNVDAEYLKKPKVWNIKFIKRFMLIFGPISSLFDFLTFIVLYSTYHNFPGAFQTGWFMESLATQSLVIHVIRTRFTPFIGSRASSALTVMTVLVVIFAWILPYTSLGAVFNLVALPLKTVLALGLIVVGYLVVAEFGKKLFYQSQVNN